MCARRSLEQEHSLRMKAELESAEYKQKLQVVTSKYGQAQKELQVRRLLPVESWNRVRLISASVTSCLNLHPAEIIGSVSCLTSKTEMS